MSRVGDDPQIRLGPREVELPRAHRRTDDVVAPLDDDGRDVADRVDVLDEPVVGLEEGVVDEVVALDARERDRFVRIAEVGDRRVVWDQLERRALRTRRAANASWWPRPHGTRRPVSPPIAVLSGPEPRPICN